jgi:hypothetical protein
MQLSEAVRLGSLLVPDPRSGDIARCAITMALYANGMVPKPEDALYPHQEVCESSEDVDDLTALPVRPDEAVSENWLHALRCHETLSQIYSWLDKSFPCPWCGKEVRGTEVVYHPFDDHVMTPGIGTVQISMDELCSWIAGIEPPLECYGVTLNLGLGVRFASEHEKDAVICAAAEAKLSANAYIAAAVRLALKNHLPVGDFQLGDPVIGPNVHVNYTPCAPTLESVFPLRYAP